MTDPFMLVAGRNLAFALVVAAVELALVLALADLARRVSFGGPSTSPTPSSMGISEVRSPTRAGGSASP